MAEHILTRTQTIELPREEVFAFFSDAANLERITPPQLRFHIVTPPPITLKKGAIIDYKLTMRGLRFGWRTEITEWEPPIMFTDRQVKGPYGQWIHTHWFSEITPTQTIIEDEVRYRLPLEPFGDIVHFFVRRELERIFDFRQRAVAAIFEKPDEPSEGVER